MLVVGGWWSVVGGWLLVVCGGCGGCGGVVVEEIFSKSVWKENMEHPCSKENSLGFSQRPFVMLLRMVLNLSSSHLFFVLKFEIQSERRVMCLP